VGGVVAVTAAGFPGLSATFGKRVLTAAVGIPLFVWIVLGAPRWVFPLFVVALSAAAAWELMRLFERGGRSGYTVLGVLGTAVVTASFALPGFTALVLTAAVAATLSAPIWTDTAGALDKVVVTLLPIVYVGWLLGHGILLGILPDSAHLILFLVGTTWAGETAALVIGSAVGRHPLAPVISPRKTVEGAIGQLAVSIITAAVLGAWLLPQWSAGMAMLTGAVLGVTGQIGDLAESVIKRSLGAKDTGGLMPGHGGVLDRLDGLLFNAPALFYCASWIGGRG
jgi:phosphatidate cytidylyltransferase